MAAHDAPLPFNRIGLGSLNGSKRGIFYNFTSTDNGGFSNGLCSTVCSLKVDVIKLIILTAEAFVKCL